MTWLLTFLGVILLDVDIGLLIGLIVSVLIIFLRDQFFTLKSFVKFKNQSKIAYKNLVENDEEIEVIQMYNLIISFRIRLI
jgi:MFS superfamily sulfate permease-like transporter